MSLAIVHTRAAAGIKALPVTVETHISHGLPGFSIVGLPEACVKESRDRVRSALINSHFEFPAKKITINLAPADLPKTGGRFDLPIALGILAASEQMPNEKLEGYEFGGELALSGELRAFHGVLPFALSTRQAKRALVIPEQNAPEAATPGDNVIYAAKHLLDVFNHVSEKCLLKPFPNHSLSTLLKNPVTHEFDFSDVQGQWQAKRVLEIAAAGGHSVLMIGSPGTGKSMLANRLPSILPPLSHEENLEVMALYSLVPNFQKIEWGKRPFRNPHHTISSAALVGGGTIPRPGEISLAHQGVLFLDELLEFPRATLEALREPLETGSISISRAARKTDFPAKFQLIAAMNPCPCGHSGDLQNVCNCTAEQIHRYQNRLSGPLLDRIDLQIEVMRSPPRQTSNASVSDNEPISPQEDGQSIRMRVIQAYERQLNRGNIMNARLTPKEIQQYCVLDSKATKLIQRSLETLGLSARSHHRILKVSRTIADLADQDIISKAHVAEALSYKKLKAGILH